MTVRMPWALSLLIHGLAAAFLLTMDISLPVLIPEPSPTRVDIRIPSRGSASSGAESSGLTGTGKEVYPLFPGKTSESPGSPGEAAGDFLTLPGDAPVFKPVEFPDFPPVDFRELYGEDISAQGSADLVWEEGSDPGLRESFPPLGDLNLTGDLEYVWTGRVTPLGQWAELPAASTGIPELDRRINTWLRSMDLKPTASGQEESVRFRLKVSLRRPQ